MAEIKRLLDEVIEQEIYNVQSLKTGGEQKSAAIKDLAALHKLRIDEIKAETEAEEKRERRVMDSEQHEAEIALKERELDEKDVDRTRDEALQRLQAKDQVIDRYVRTGIAVGELVLPLIFYGIWMNRGFKFEETGSFTSTTFRNLMNRFKPTR